eukprot:scaffold13675_cov60-Phaeocystis_antarctica.AAC.2
MHSAAGLSMDIVGVTCALIGMDGLVCVQLTHGNDRTPAHVARRAACGREERTSVEECGEQPHASSSASSRLVRPRRTELVRRSLGGPSKWAEFGTRRAPDLDR